MIHFTTQHNLLHSYYGDSADPAVNTRYLSQIRERAADVASKYPGWTMRVYYDGAEDDFDAVSEMCDIWCSSDHVDFCDVNSLPRPFGNLKSLMPVGELRHKRSREVCPKQNGHPVEYNCWTKLLNN